MKIIRNKNKNKNLNITIETDFSPDLGKEESLKQFEDETLRKIINPVENYETARFSYQPYSGITENPEDLSSDIWYKFLFYNYSGGTYDGGLDYSLVDISYSDNASLHKKVTNSFFRLEFFKVDENDSEDEDFIIDRSNRKLVMTKNLPITSSERVFYTPTNDYIFVPFFIGSNYRHNELSFLYWFQTDEIFSESILSGNTFYMTARFFNAGDGSILNFVNKDTIGNEIEETDDFYYKVVIDRDNYTYEVLTMNNDIIGRSNDPITFYQIPF